MKAWGLTTFLFCFMAGASSLMPELDVLVGKSFVFSGPNCFSTALVASGVHETFRGVSEREFQKTLHNNCEPVAEPEPGDMGVYSSPDGALGIHAFIHLGNGMVLEKRGVHFGENNNVHVSPFVQTETIYGQSNTCLRYSPGPECYNKLQYYRCHSREPSSDEESLVDLFFEQILTGEIQGARLKASLSELEGLVQKLEDTQSSSPERLYSYQKQLEYIRLEL